MHRHVTFHITHYHVPKSMFLHSRIANSAERWTKAVRIPRTPPSTIHGSLGEFGPKVLNSQCRSVDLLYPSKSEKCMAAENEVWGGYLLVEKFSFAYVRWETRTMGRKPLSFRTMYGLAVYPGSDTETLERSSLSVLLTVKRNFRVIDEHMTVGLQRFYWITHWVSDISTRAWDWRSSTGV